MRVVEKLQNSNLASVNACSGVKMQQYFSLISNVDTASYFPGLPTSCCQMEAAQASGATPKWFAMAGSGNRSLSLFQRNIDGNALPYGCRGGEATGRISSIFKFPTALRTITVSVLG